MGKICFVKSCPSGRKLKRKAIDASQPLSFFRPTTLAKLEQWNMALSTTMKNTDYICHLHFKAEDIKMYETFNIQGQMLILPTGKKTLRGEAVPTIEHQFIPTPVHELQANVLNKSLQGNSNCNNSKENQDYQVKENEDTFKQQELLVDQGVVDNSMDITEETDHYLKMSQETHNSRLNKEEPKVTSQSAGTFLDNIKSSLLPQSWLYLETPKGLEFIRMNVPKMEILNRVRVNKDLAVTVIFSNDEELNVNDNITSFNSISDYLKWVERWPLCIGTQIDKKKYSAVCRGVIVGDDSYKRNQANPRCKSCRILRHRLQKSSSTLTILDTQNRCQKKPLVLIVE